MSINIVRCFPIEKKQNLKSEFIETYTESSYIVRHMVKTQENL